MITDQMMQNQVINNINTDTAMADILDNLSYDYVYHVITDSINIRFRPYLTPMPNIPYSLEQNFIIQLDAAPGSRDQILAKRDEVYRQIIEMLCTYYNLTYHESDDVYTDAFYLYRFLVSDFTNTVIQFFVNFILRDKKQIYDRLDLQDKKNKDSSYAYSKKIYSNNVIALIHANIASVIADIVTYDISLNDIINIIYSGTEASAAYHISHIISDNGYFYDYIRSYAVNDYAADVINTVKLTLQSVSADYQFKKITAEEAN